MGPVIVITLACVAGSVVITTGIVYAITGTFAVGVGGFVIAILVPAVLAPLASYRLASLAVRLREANEKLQALSRTDPLTQTCNRRHFLEVAEAHLVLARRHGFPTSLLLIDFDDFKAINDELGHLAGDDVLVVGSRIIRETLRDSDTLARFGGEEFIVLLPHTSRAGAAAAAERIVSAIRRHEFGRDGRDMSVTVSIGGITCETSATSLERLTSTADKLMYAAKAAGRDCCRIDRMELPDAEAASRGPAAA